jgi:hypothetical protein
MLICRGFKNELITKMLLTIPKTPIFTIGTGGGKQVSGFYQKYNDELNFLEPLIKYHQNILNKYQVKISGNIFVENRDFIFNKNDEPFEGKLHQDSYEDSNKGCITAVYYYHIDNTIKGGDLCFPPFITHKPKEGQIIYFDGDYKHKINKLYGEGLRGTVICSFEKKLI